MFKSIKESTVYKKMTRFNQLSKSVDADIINVINDMGRYLSVYDFSRIDIENVKLDILNIVIDEQDNTDLWYDIIFSPKDYCDELIRKSHKKLSFKNLFIFTNIWVVLSACVFSIIIIILIDSVDFSQLVKIIFGLYPIQAKTIINYIAIYFACVLLFYLYRKFILTYPNLKLWRYFILIGFIIMTSILIQVIVLDIILFRTNIFILLILSIILLYLGLKNITYYY